MTMEERSRGIDDGAPVISTGAPTNSSSPNKPNSKACEMTGASFPLQRTSKRSFDVAFLVAPDEKLIRRQTEKLVNLQYCTSRLMSDAIRQQENSSRLPISRDDYNEDSREYEQSDRAPQNLTIKHFEGLEQAHGKYKLRRTEEPQAVIPPYISPKRRLTPTSSSLSPEPPVQHPYATGPLGIQKSPSPPSMFQRSLQARKLFADESSADCPAVDPCLGLKNSCDGISCPDRLQGDSRSAFTKVNLTVQRNSLVGVSPNPGSIGYDDGTASSISPRSSVSPDVIAYQNSLSPPIGAPTSSPGGFASKYASPASSFPAKMTYPFLMSPESQQSALLDNLKLTQQQQSQSQSQSPPKVPSSSSSPAKNGNTGAGSGFRPELPSAVYPSLPYNHPLSTVFPPIGDALGRPRLLAAASLLPSSLAALALPAQNVCAKCNLSFRMTSDLVYHMRSHHKSEHAGEAARRRREEKLRCPVCDESFRERHHLTRHMTAHQDKESDAVVDQVEIKRRAAAAATAAAAAAATLVHSGK